MPHARDNHGARWAVLLAIACASCDGPAPSVSDAEVPRNLILISLDTVRADHLGCYGYERATSPTIDALAEGGVLFETASATSCWTVPTHASMLTGVYPRTHGVNGWNREVPAEITRLPAVLAERGFETAAFVNTSILSEKRGFSRGFDSYELIPHARNHRGAAPTIIAKALDWIDAHGEGRFFLFLHFYDAHSNYDPAPPFRDELVRPYSGPASGRSKQLRKYLNGELPTWDADDGRYLSDLYDAGLAQLDAELARLFDALRDSGVWSETAVILTADHGEEFLEHGGVMHGETLYQEQLHVPLILLGPGISVGKRVEGNVSQVDIMPTALALLGVPNPPGMEGLDLTGTWSDTRADRISNRLSNREVYSEVDKWHHMEKGDSRGWIRRGDVVLHYDRLSGNKTLFDLAADPLERDDLAEREVALRDDLWTRLEGYLQSGRVGEDTFELTERELRKLKELGY